MKSKLAYISLITIICAIALSYGMMLSLLNHRLVDFSVLEHYNPGKPSILLDDQGMEWGRFELDRRKLISMHEIPQPLIDAFLAAEDHKFFEHHGISFKGIARSMLVNLRHRKIVQGASTITQQLVKLLYTDSQRTFSRKVKEQIVSLLVERQFTKEQILEIYLNHVYFGCGIYGVEAAAQRFFNKSVQQLNFAECATIAGIVKSPGQYCPLLNLTSATNRRNTILHQLVQLKKLSASDCKRFCDSELKLTGNNTQVIAPHLKESLRQQLEAKFGREQLYSGGLTIKTTLNIATQKIAQQQFEKQFQKLQQDLMIDVDGGLITMNVQTGEIKAMVGGVDYQSSKFNRAWQAKRQMGSIFKPIVYAAAIQAGYNFAQTEIDEPIEVVFQGQSWKPRNSNREFTGEMTFAKALSYSNNIVTIKALIKAGCKNVAQLGEKFQLPGPINPYPSIALGCIDVTLPQAVGAFNVFANHGTYVEPHYLKWVKDEWGTKVMQATPQQIEVLEPKVSGQVTKVLGIGLNRFLRKVGRSELRFEGIGKTGTTNDSRTCWFMGSTPELTTGIYLGCDDNGPLGKGIFPVWTIFPIWLAIYERLIQTEQKFSYDSSLKPMRIDWNTGYERREINEDSVEILI